MHSIHFHQKDDVFQCKVCHYTAKEKSALFHHIKDTHSKIERENEGGQNEKDKEHCNKLENELFTMKNNFERLQTLIWRALQKGKMYVCTYKQPNIRFTKTRRFFIQEQHHSKDESDDESDDKSVANDATVVLPIPKHVSLAHRICSGGSRKKSMKKTEEKLKEML